MPRMLALAVLLALILPKPLAFASPPDPTWIGGIYDRADGDDAVMRTVSRTGSIGVSAAVPRPAPCSEPLVARDLPVSEYRQPAADARGPPGGRCPAEAQKSAAPSPVPPAHRSLAAPPVSWSARSVDPARPSAGLARLRGPPPTAWAPSRSNLERCSPISRRPP